MSTRPNLLHTLADINLVTYVDDCTLLPVGKDIGEMENALNNYLSALKDFFADGNLT